ncbi:MAG TPA: hypothetical protein VG937_27145 [Polyangiaceae bacterium]|nr:hypothetical protein [Polyangiaceae bacterium]
MQSRSSNAQHRVLRYDSDDFEPVSFMGRREKRDIGTQVQAGGFVPYQVNRTSDVRQKVRGNQTVDGLLHRRFYDSEGSCKGTHCDALIRVSEQPE